MTSAYGFHVDMVACCQYKEQQPYTILFNSIIKIDWLGGRREAAWLLRIARIL